MSLQDKINNAIAYQNSGRLQDAEKLYREVLAVDPHQATALHLLGVLAHQTGNPDAAEALITKSLKLRDNDPTAYSNLGCIYKDQDKLGDAISCFQKAISLRPRFVDAYNNLGIAYAAIGRHKQALCNYRRALKLQPGQPKTHYLMGVLYEELGEFYDALAHYENAIAIQPRMSEAYNNRGTVLRELGRLDEAVKSLSDAIAIRPDYPEAHNNLGITLKYKGMLEDAVINYRRAITLRPDYASAHSNLGNTLKDQGKLDAAIESFDQAIAIDSKNLTAYSNRAYVRQQLGQFKAAANDYNAALLIKPDFHECHSSSLCTAQYMPNLTLLDLKELHGTWEKRHAAQLKCFWPKHDRLEHAFGSLRVGLVSPDFRSHPVGSLIYPVLSHKEQLEHHITCYSDCSPDNLTNLFKQLSDNWVDTRGMSDEALFDRISHDEIHILIDLAGHSANNRMLLFARKPSPVQVTWAGYVGTTGLSAIDYLIADWRQIPKELEDGYVETIVRMPDGWVCYQPPDYAPKIGPLPFFKNGYITFGCLNNPAKINNQVIEAWADILKQVPNSKLIMKYRGLETLGNRGRILTQFDQLGIENSRIMLEGGAVHLEHLNRYNDIDIALDTFPYSGGITTCEALWMGVPVITVPGDTFASRHSLSHLTSLGLEHLAAFNKAQFVDIASSLSNDIRELDSLRKNLRQRMKSSPLCDGKSFTSNFSKLISTIWEHHIIS